MCNTLKLIGNLLPVSKWGLLRERDLKPGNNDFLTVDEVCDNSDEKNQ